MKVKLTCRETTQDMEDAGREHIAWDGFHAGEPGHQRLKTGRAWEAAHDAAPDDATRALVDLLWAVQQLRHGPNSEHAVHARYVDTYLGKFMQTDEGTALIRQAMESTHE